MKRLIGTLPKNYLLLLLFIGGSHFIFAQCPTPVWADEFDGSSLDLAKWNYQIGDGCDLSICGWGNNELQSYQQDNVTVSDGTLKITAKKERIRGSKYTSGRINSKGKADFAYGRLEASIKLPVGDGLWPAFWMLSTDEPYGGWPQSGEIDIMEFVASDPDNILGYIHYGDPSPNNQSQGNNYTLPSGTFPEAFHEFAIEWEPGEIRWFMDDILYSVKKAEDVAPYNWPFDHDFHFLLNVAVGGNLGGPVVDNMLPGTMEVEYVRVYNEFKPYLGGETVVENQAQGVSYTIGNLANGVNVTWTVPAGATIVSGQGSSSIVVDFGTESGNVSAVFDDGCGVKTLSVPVEVEPVFSKSFSFENFDDPATAIFASATGILTEVANPASNTVNSSALSGKYDRNSAEQYDVLVYNVSNITDASEYVNKAKKFYIDVYSSAPIGTQILLQLETATATASNYPAGRHSRYIATITENNNWHRLAFSLLDQPDGGASNTGVENMILLFASNSFTGDTYYFDNLDSYSAGGGGSNQSPTVSISSPANNSNFATNTPITITADAADPDGTVSQVEFFVDGNTIGTDVTSPYSVDWIVTQGETTLTAVATDDENASTTSAAVTVTGETTGTATSVHVASIVTGTAGAGQGKKYGTATVTIVDDLGTPTASAQVTGTFSGTFGETVSGTTNGNGVVVLQTSGTAKGGVTVNLCVDDVVASLPYDPAANVITCSNGSAAQTLINNTPEQKANLQLYPNPAKDILNITLPHYSNTSTVQILTAKGEVLFTRKLDGGQFSLDISSLNAGLYIVKVMDEFNNVQVGKFVK